MPDWLSSNYARAQVQLWLSKLPAATFGNANSNDFLTGQLSVNHLAAQSERSRIILYLDLLFNPFACANGKTGRMVLIFQSFLLGR